MGKPIRWVAGAVAVLLMLPLILAIAMTAMLPGTPAIAGPVCTGGSAGTGWTVPFAQTYQVTSEFGYRKHPVTQEWKLHTGIDLAATVPPGQVIAAAAGTVVTAGPQGGYGHAVTIDHGAGITTLYAHLARIAPGVVAGAAIGAGSPVGVEGATGTATGVHLHFEVRLEAVPVNPRTWMLETHGIAFDGTPGGGTGGDEEEGLRDYDIGPVLPVTQYLANSLGTRFDIDTIYGWRRSDPYPDHPGGYAADFMVYQDTATGDALAAYAQANAARYSVDYIIWYQRIWSVDRADEGWRPMEDRGGVTANHKDHVHISVFPDGDAPAGGAGGCTFLGGVLTRDNLAGGAGGDRGDELAGWAFELSWEQVNPADGVWNFTALDGAIAYATEHGQRFRLRIPGMDTAPSHVKALAGGPVPFRDHDRHRDTSIARFWTSEVQDAYRDLMTQLAGHIAGNPVVGEVQIGGTGLITPETMLLMGGEKTADGTTNAEHLRRAGLTDALREEVWKADIAMMSTAWPATPLTLWCHPWQRLDGGSSLATTIDLVEYARTINPRIAVGHNGTDQDTIEGGTPIWQFYDYLIENRYPIALQTRSLDGGYDGNHPLGDLNTILTWAADNGVMSVELPRGWQRHVDPDVLAAANAAMAANARAAGITPPPDM